jgi:ABC-2 type transport system ATP-binding protein
VSVILEARGIEKHFTVGWPFPRGLVPTSAQRRRVHALRGVSLRAEAGEITGIIGPNGAGKTTLLRVLADILEPDAGWVAICGQRRTKTTHDFRRRIGYVSSDERNSFWRLTGRQNLAFFAALYGVRRAEADRQISATLSWFGLSDTANRPFRDYSSGTRKKFALARALIHRPNVVLMDEVTNSLDPASADAVKALMRQYVSAEPDRAVLWSTHRLEEVGEICDKVVSVNDGRFGFLGSTREFIAAQAASDAFSSGSGRRPRRWDLCQPLTASSREETSDAAR